ncbi:MAG: DNA-binding protein WhiA [Clostridiales bacterium]|jgi:DNA-binding protein WhiA|nr:DNA-binding protein WhiA [Clostridiales bacterium]
MAFVNVTVYQRGISVSFSSDVKKELSAHYGMGRHCDIAELAAVINVCGEITRQGAGRGVAIKTESNSLAKKCFTLIKNNFKINSKLSITKNKQLHKGHFYSLEIADEKDAERLLSAVGIKRKHANGQKFDIHNRRVCCMRSYLRGAFLAGGSLTNPEKNYHMEFVTAEEGTAQSLKELLSFFNITGRIILRKGHYVVYLKGAESIVDVLNLMGAHVSLMNLENVRILKFTRNQVNRAVNCETANINKTVASAVSQIKCINLIENLKGLDFLPRPLMEVARARLQFPEASLKEIGAMMSPPVGKSGVNYRLRKICEIAELLRRV